MNSMSCDECAAAADPGNQLDFCWYCCRDLCDECAAAGCCGRIPATSGTRRANVLYRVLGGLPPLGVASDGEESVR